jgi:CspA family cold shock protein
MTAGVCHVWSNHRRDLRMTAEQALSGTICTIRLDGGYGFIAVGDGQNDIFFHQSALPADLEWGEQLLERRVTFETFQGRKGMQARNIRAAEN